jgi:Tfp pilus assembly protein PilF
MTKLIRSVALYSAVVLFAMYSWTANAATQPQPGHYRAAETALARGNADQASRELKLALQANPLDPNAHYMLGSLMARQGLEDQAMIGFRRAIMIDPTNAEAIHNLGTLLLQRGQAIPAAQLLEAAVDYNPDYIPPYNSLAKAYFLAGLPELAIATYQEVLRRDPANTIASQNFDLLLAAAEQKPEESAGPKPGQNQADLPIDLPGGDLADLPVPPEKNEKSTDTPKPPPPKPKPDTASETSTPSSGALRKLMQGLPYLMVEEHDDVLALTGWTRGKRERDILDRILARWPKILDLTGIDAGDPQRMIEVDVVLFVVTGTDLESVGFNFLRLVSTSFTYFNKNPASSSSDWQGLNSPGTIDKLVKLPHWGSLFVASVDYDVNIANAADERVAVLARPHLTTLSGTPAYFLAGGEIVFRVSGIESGDIKPYPFGTSVSVTPTLLRTPGEDGTPRVHLNIQAQRTSVLEFLTAQTSEDTVNFDKLNVTSQAVLALGQTLILSGLNQRESRLVDSGVPILKSIPLLKYLFSQKTTVETNTAIIILLTPRDPAFNDNSRRKALAKFVQMRRAFIKAQKGTKKDMRKFRNRYPNYRDLVPNRFASHFFLLENSDIYRRVSGEDIIDEDLDLHLLELSDEDKKKDRDEKKKEKKNDKNGKKNKDKDKNSDK